ncbi:AbrB/MazE/SpoVT family DNA-binding domain-containing protein [Stygiolobus caldivivus]|uniref:Uncharacterized protein n=1 Tax=Stygiolobus caldivivus TaxID=2824673 RepID=A0A8D5U859_9CREN|nr:AbrB/MazE/SpoVT family DNA-binding domain-containing protein [Stygiolobus caldivivus]BCU70820.1 hypothetical protein KN1_21170 [Stygiolobus caldivivus]
MKPRVYKGGRPGHTTYYLLIPKDIVDSLGITPEDDFVLNTEIKDGEITLCYKRVKKA